MTALEVFLWGVAAFWAFAAANAVLNALFIPRLPRDAGNGALPPLSVIVPARNEERGIGPALEALCAQDHPDFEVVVVDDGSTDRTHEILADLSRRHPNLQVVRGEEPPSGWLGKPNAQRVGLERARGEHLLFVDADVRYAPGVLRRAAAEFERRRLDMLLLLATLEARGLERVLMSNLDAFTLYVAPVFLSNVQAFRGFAFGAGSGNLVRRRALEAAGGLEAIRDEVVDDVAMGRRIKACGGRFRFVTAFGDVRVRMYDGLASAVEGFTKNYFAFFRFNPLMAALLEGGNLMVHSAPAGLLLLAPFLGLSSGALALAGASFGAGLLLNAALCLWSAKPLWIAPLFPLRPLLWGWILLRSARRYYRRGIVWRGRRYERPRSGRV
jgi:glycosyltransferase involved in cell wall biosynthesis